MCECGCSMGNPMYRLPVNSSKCYVVELYAGCRNCSAPPGMIIYEVVKSAWNWDDVQEFPVMPFNQYDATKEMAFECAPDPENFSEAIREQVKTGQFGKRVEDVCDDLAEMIWDESIRRYPKMIHAKETLAKNDA